MDKRIKCEESVAGYKRELQIICLTEAPNRQNEWKFSVQIQVLRVLFQENYCEQTKNLIEMSLYFQVLHEHNYKNGYGDLL